MEPGHVVVAGGGIAGLAAAWELARAGGARRRPRVTVLEASERLGGKIWTERTAAGLVEWGPDAFLAAKEPARRLAEELGLDGELVSPAPLPALMLLGGRLRPLPRGLALGVPTSPRTLLDAVRSGILDVPSATRAALEPLLPRSRVTGGSAGELLTARLGARAAERLAAPLLAGIYGASPAELDARTVFPSAGASRSLVLAMRGRPRPAGPVFLAPRDGMGAFIERLAERLDEADVEVRTGAAAGSLRAGKRGGYRIETPAGEIGADAVVLATTATAAARLLRGVSTGAAGGLGMIRDGASAIVHIRWDAGTAALPEATGYLAAAGEEHTVAACSFVRRKWPHLPGDDVWVRSIVTDPVALALPDAELTRRAVAETAAALGAPAGKASARMRRWERALPVYEPGHGARVAAAQRALPPGLAVAGAYLDGVGVPDCIRTGREAARRIRAFLDRPA